MTRRGRFHPLAESEFVSQSRETHLVGGRSLDTCDRLSAMRDVMIDANVPVDLREGDEYPVWSPYDSFAAADALQEFLRTHEDAAT